MSLNVSNHVDIGGSSYTNNWCFFLTLTAEADASSVRILTLEKEVKELKSLLRAKMPPGNVEILLISLKKNVTLPQIKYNLHYNLKYIIPKQSHNRKLIK